MTLPVLSEREVRNILATKKLCPQCQGVCRVVVNVATRIYRCGYYTAAVRCPLCGGTGLVSTITVNDRLSAAAGDARKEAL